MNHTNTSWIKRHHGLLMILCCIIPILLVIGAVTLFGAGSTYATWLILLLCPIMHYFMMKDMDHGKDHKGHGKNAMGNGKDRVDRRKDHIEGDHQ